MGIKIPRKAVGQAPSAQELPSPELPWCAQKGKRSYPSLPAAPHTPRLPAFNFPAPLLHNFPLISLLPSPQDLPPCCHHRDLISGPSQKSCWFHCVVFLLQPNRGLDILLLQWPSVWGDIVFPHITHLAPEPSLLTLQEAEEGRVWLPLGWSVQRASRGPVGRRRQS